ncbi:hypothetical protein MKX03_033764 [Papaver bracteatum]|nr:hypothetical protein MKX03_033764 [Papaver bracteatum]
METHFLSSSVKKSKIEINLEDALNHLLFHYRWIFLWYTKLVEKLHMLSSISGHIILCTSTSEGSLYLRQVERRTLSICGVIMKVVTNQQDLAVQEVEHQDSLEKIWVVLQQSISNNLRFKPSPLDELLGFIFSKFKMKYSCILSYLSKICNA